MPKTTSASTEAPVRFIRRPEVQSLTGLSRSGIYARTREGTFPAPIRIGERAIAWLETDIHQWMADRVAASRIAE